MTQSVSIRLDEEVLNKLDVLTKAAERSRAWLMAHAIEQYVQHESWQIEAIQTTLNKVINSNAKFANDEETVRWLQSWGVIRNLKRQ
jgi:predicted transcriptional regulator